MYNYTYHIEGFGEIAGAGWWGPSVEGLLVSNPIAIRFFFTKATLLEKKRNNHVKETTKHSPSPLQYQMFFNWYHIVIMKTVLL